MWPYRGTASDKGLFPVRACFYLDSNTHMVKMTSLISLVCITHFSHCYLEKAKGNASKQYVKLGSARCQNDDMVQELHRELSHLHSCSPCRPYLPQN